MSTETGRMQERMDGNVSKLRMVLHVCLCLVTSVMSLCDPVDCTPPGFSVHGVFPARILEWVAMPFSRGSSIQGSNLGLLHCRWTLCY